MRRYAFLIVLPLLFVTVAACESSTDLAEVDLVGRWDGVGPLQDSQATRGLQVSIQSDANGAFSGTWTLPGRGSSPVSGTKGAGGEVEFKLLSYPGPDPTFEGQLTWPHRMVGSFAPALATDEAVFLRGSIDP